MLYSLKFQEYAQYLKAVESTLLELQAKQPELYDRLSRHLNTSVSAFGASRIGANITLIAMVARSICLARYIENVELHQITNSRISYCYGRSHFNKIFYSDKSRCIYWVEYWTEDLRWSQWPGFQSRGICFNLVNIFTKIPTLYS